MRVCVCVRVCVCACDLAALISVFAQDAGEEVDETQDMELQQLMKQ